MNAGIQWIKNHKAVAAGIAVAVFLAVYLYSKSRSASGSGNSSGGLTAADANFLQTQAGVQVAALQAGTQQNIAATNAQTQQDYIAAMENVANNQTAAQLQATQGGYAVESQAIQTQGNEYTTAINAGLQEEENQQALAKYVTSFGGSQNRLAFLQSVLNQPTAAAATEQSYANVQYAGAAQTASIVNGITGGASRVLTGLFG